ncbi:MAG: hypothetical protein ACI89X_001330 [Planctomycetota bacterium]|jgi:hypothetical protein
MRIALVLAGSLLLGSTAAQDPVDPKPEVQAQASAADCAAAIKQMQQQAYTDWRASIKKAKEGAENADGKPIKAMAMRPDYGPVAKKAAGFAKQFAGTDDAVQFLMLVVQFSTDKDAQKAGIEQMLKSHIDSPALAQMGRMLDYLDRMINPEFAASTKKSMLESKNADVRAWALLATHKAAIETADRESGEYGDAKKALLAAAEAVEDVNLAKQMRSAIDLREKYGVGCEAPDIAGIDLDGVEFKLSDYKGKVIFLDFWGDW